MGLGFTIRYHPKVVKDDIPALSKVLKVRMHKAIETKLAVAPEKFGKPLRQSLRGYRKLRIGDHRIVFRIEARSVYILAILHRSVVYKRTPIRTADDA